MDKKYLKQVLLYLLTSLLSIGVMLYIGYHLFYGLTQRIETAPASPATVHSVLEADVYLFREESLLRCGVSGGSVVPAVSDGTRVGIGDTVARLYDRSAPDTVAAIAETETEIAVLTAMQEHVLSVRDTLSIDQEIYKIMEKIAAAGRAGNGAAALSCRTELRAALSRRAVVTGTTDTAAEIARLEAKKNALTKELGTCRKTAVAEKSGYYYAKADGYESVFTAEAARTMSPDTFRTLCKTEAAPLPADAVGKLVTDYEWYAACLLPYEKAETFAVGKTYAVSFPYAGDLSLSMTLTRAVRDGDTMMLVFSSGRMPEGFSYTRLQPAVITDNAYTGLRVPASAVRAVDGVTGVYVLEGGVVHYRAVRLLAEGEDWCLLAADPADEPPAGLFWLKQNEIVITKGRGLYEGRILS